MIVVGMLYPLPVWEPAVWWYKPEEGYECREPGDALHRWRASQVRASVDTRHLNIPFERPEIIPRPSCVRVLPREVERYNTVELRYPGEYGYLRLGGNDHPGQWSVWSEGGSLLRNEVCGGALPQCVLIGHWIGRERLAPTGRVGKRVPMERNADGAWTPGRTRPIGRAADKIGHGTFVVFDIQGIGGMSFTNLRLAHRRTLLEHLVGKSQQWLPWLQTSRMLDAHVWRDLWDAKVQQGSWGGLVFKRWDESFHRSTWGVMRSEER